MSAESRRRILYFEPDVSGGHKVVYMDHLARYQMEQTTDVELVFLAGDSPELARLSWWAPACAGRIPHLRALVLLKHRAQACRTGSLLWRGVVQARAATEVARRERADFILFGWIDHALAGIAARQVGVPCAGILFRTPELPARGRAARAKAALCRLALSNPRLATLFALDRDFAEGFDARAGRVRHLADPFTPTPLPASGPLTEFHARARADGRRIYLGIGAIDERKGVIQCLDALASLDSEHASRAALVIAGRVAPHFRKRLAGAVASARNSAPGLAIEVLDRFVDDAEYRWLLDLADVVLLLYQRGHQGSSGTMVQAAAAGKPVLGTAAGLIGHEIVSFGLGSAVAADQTSAIHDAIRKDLSSPMVHSPDSRGRYLAGRDPFSFASMLLRRPQYHIGSRTILTKQVGTL